MDAFWPEFEKNGYDSIDDFTDPNIFTDDELKEIGMKKSKIQYFRRLLGTKAVRNYLIVAQGPLSDDEIANSTAPGDTSSPADAKNSVSASIDGVPVNDCAHVMDMLSVADHSNYEQSEDAASYEKKRSAADVVLRDNLLKFLVSCNLEKFETALIDHGLCNLASLDHEELATNDALAACGLGALETRKLRIFLSKYKNMKPEAFDLPSAESGTDIHGDKSLASMLTVGDTVTWEGSDKELPAGAMGKIVQIHHEYGDAECLFETAAGPKTFTFALTRLNRVLVVGDFVTWKSSDDELPKGAVGKIVQVYHEDGDAECLFETETGPKIFTLMLSRLNRIVNVNTALAAGDSVTWQGSDEELPEGTLGKVVEVHHEDGDAECIFETAAGPKTFTFSLTRLNRIEPPKDSTSGPIEVDPVLIKGKYTEMLKSKGLVELDKAAFRELVKKLLKEDFQQFAEANWPKDKDLDAAFAATDQNKSGGISGSEFLGLFQVVVQGDVKDLGKLRLFSKKKRASFKNTFQTVVAVNTLREQHGAANTLIKWRKHVVALRAARALEEVRSFLKRCKLQFLVEALKAHGIACMAALQDSDLATDEALMACMSKLELRRLRVFLAKRNGVTVFSPASARISSENATLRASSDMIATSDLMPTTPKRGMVAGLFGDVDRSSLQRFSLDAEEGDVLVSPESMRALPKRGMVAGLFGDADRSSLQRFSLDAEEGDVSVSPELMPVIPKRGMVAGLFGDVDRSSLQRHSLEAEL